MPKISAVIITFNEEQYIGQCINSLQDIADEIVVVDSFSTDKTEAICASHGVKFIRHAFESYVDQKNFALTHASNDYILSLDADEVLSDELKKSILGVKDGPKHDGYYFNRLNNYCGKWIKHSRLYPDRHLRLFNRTRGRWVGPNPHDRFILDQGCRTGRLKGDLLHWIYSSLEDHVDKMNRFSTIAAEEYKKAGKKAGPCSATIHCTWGFFRSYFLNAGFLDGYLGFVGCSITAYGSFLKYAKLRQLNAEKKPDNT
jgi:glycosyltransferase involved in cell wall biosynthesis